MRGQERLLIPLVMLTLGSVVMGNKTKPSLEEKRIPIVVALSFLGVSFDWLINFF